MGNYSLPDKDHRHISLSQHHLPTCFLSGEKGLRITPLVAYCYILFPRVGLSLMGQSNWESNAFLWSPWSWQQWWLLPREWESGNSHENSWASQENSDTWESGKRFGGWILPLPHGNWHSTAKLECYSIMNKTDFFQKAFLTPPDKLICSHLFSYSSEHMIILKILSPCILNICLHHCLPSTLRSYYKQWLNLTQLWITIAY